MEALDMLAWPVGRAGEAMAELAVPGWHAVQARSVRQNWCMAVQALHGWLEAAAAWLGVEAELVEVPYTEVASLVSGAGPALLCLGAGKAQLSGFARASAAPRAAARAGPGGAPGPRGGPVPGLLPRR